MLSKNFIFTALFFVVVLFCISCLGNEPKKEYKKLYTILPTDSSNFTISLDGIETIKTPAFSLDGKWKLINEDSLQNSKSLYLFFEGRKIFSALNSDSFKPNNYQIFATYNKCPDENGTYDKRGRFLVIGSGNEKLICYEVLSHKANKLILYDVDKGGELEFEKVK